MDMPHLVLQLVNQVLSLYLAALNSSKTIESDSATLRYMEETPNKGDGSRFLLEMDVQLSGVDGETVHTSEYVYLKAGSDVLCHTSNFEWKKQMEVYFVVTGLCVHGYRYIFGCVWVFFCSFVVFVFWLFFFF